MKKYKCRTPLVSTKKFGISVLCAAIAALIISLIFGIDSKWTVISYCPLIYLLFTYISVHIAVLTRYSYCDKFIQLWYLSFTFKKIRYSDINSICVSNAAYNNGFSRYDTIFPMMYKSKDREKVLKTVFPFITLHKPDYPIHKLNSGMYSRDLYNLDDEEIFCLGICWFDSFKELLNHTNCPVYVLEDVYLRFKGMFDMIFMQYNDDNSRFYIITDHEIEYSDFLNLESQ